MFSYVSFLISASFAQTLRIASQNTFLRCFPLRLARISFAQLICVILHVLYKAMTDSISARVGLSVNHHAFITHHFLIALVLSAPNALFLDHRAPRSFDLIFYYFDIHRVSPGIVTGTSNLEHAMLDVMINNKIFGGKNFMKSSLKQL